MKKFYFSFLPFLLALFVCVGFASCSDGGDDELNGPEVIEAVTGTWKGEKLRGGGSMTAKFYSDSTVEIWWASNPLLCTYYFSGIYDISKKKILFKGRACTNGSSLSSGWDVNETTSYSIKNGVLSFDFDLKQEWVLRAQ